MPLLIITLLACPGLVQADHVLAREGQVVCEVVVHEQAGPVAWFAGQELAQLLGEALGKTVPLVRQPTQGVASLIVGRSPQALQAGIDLDAIGRDGFVIRTMGEDIVIVGRDDMRTDVPRLLATSSLLKRQSHFQRGSLSGVYHFLETQLGVRFYFPGQIGTIIPRHSSLTIPPLDIQEAPDHPARDSGYSGLLPDGTDGQASYPYKSLHRLRQRLQTQYIPNVHGLRDLDLVRRFGDTHPEYFALLPDGTRHTSSNLRHAGHLCFSSGVREVIYQDAKAFLTGQSAQSRDIRSRGGSHNWSPANTQPGYFNLMPQDGFVPCACEACQKHYKGVRFSQMDQQAASTFIWGFVAEVARKLEEENVPGNITMMAYAPYKLVPEVDLPDNVMVMVATAGPWNVQGFKEEQTLIRQWNAKLSGRKVWMWNYISKHGEMSMPGVPCITPQTVGQYYSQLAPDISGAYLGCASDRYIYQVLNTYIASKVLWDNDFDVPAGIEEYHVKMFGRASGPMQEITRFMERTWVERIAGNQVVTDLGPTSIPPSPHTLWMEIYDQQAMAQLASLFDKARAAASGDDASLARVDFMRRNLLDVLAQQRQAYMDDLQQLAGLRGQSHALADGQRVTVDGVLDEPAWQGSVALLLGAFPSQDASSQQPRTRVRLAHDDTHLYIAIDADEPAMDRMIAPKRDRDDRAIFRDSAVEVFLNPTGDRKAYYHLAINAAGSLVDQAGTKQATSQAYDWNWDSHASLMVKHREGGWCAELAIPLSSLPGLEPAAFPANFTRTRVIDGQPTLRYSWSPYLIHGFHDVQQYGQIALQEPQQASIIRNGDFTDQVVGRSFGGWYYHPHVSNGDNVWAIDQTHWVTGGQSLRLTGVSGQERISVKQSLPELKSETTYYVSYSLKMEGVTPSGNAGGFRVSIWDKKNNYFPTTGFLIGDTSWRKEGFRFTTSKQVNATTESYISLILFEATGQVWIDDVNIVEQAAGQ